MFYHQRSLRQIYQQILKHYNRDKKYLDKVRKSWLSQMNILSKKYLSKEIDFSRFTLSKLIDEYKKFYKLYIETCGIAHLVEAITLTTDVELKDKLLKKYLSKKTKNWSLYFNKLIAHPEISIIEQDELDLLKIALNYPKNQKKLKVHKNKFGFIGYDFQGPVWDLNIDLQHQRHFKIAQKLIYIRGYSKFFISIQSRYLIDKLIKEIARRLKLTTRELRSLRVSEMIKYYQGKIKKT